ncbi:hypothetical protein J1N35_040660 [Gossypium stocksii]|uniref:RRM domain-containing protein n=1 Tax=Gossypium stocksii TaxID=47602 RepID=A0A9D3UEE0_9ROSI|nr:hypothetical protein J1N35_040660 [Gossypium stocksii]
MHWKGLWKLFWYHGYDIDAFILTKNSKSGRKFGFMRFNKIMDAQRVINRLNGFVILRNRVLVYLVRFKVRRQVWRKVPVKGDSKQNMENHKEGIVSGKKEIDIKLIVGERAYKSRDDLSLKEVMDVKIFQSVRGVGYLRSVCVPKSYQVVNHKTKNENR